VKTQVTIVETTSGNRLSSKVSAALTQAVAGQGKLDPEILSLEGMSGKKYRLFINNLIGLLGDARYLEIGVWLGSTLCAAVNGNKVSAFAIDNWSQFGGSADRILPNLDRFKGDAAVRLLDSDFRAVDFAAIGKFNVYLFDGPHTEKDQFDGVTAAQPALDDQFVLIVDDWNWSEVRVGTLKAVMEIGLRLDFAAEIRTTLDNTHPEPIAAGPNGDWHNGYFIAACTKPPHG
jgi:hypothetical protein